MKQTAVEWFKEELEKQLDFKAVEKFWGGLYDQAKEMEKEQIIDAIDQAKEMEKEQIEDFFNAGVRYGSGSIMSTQWGDDTEEYNFEQYYNETFKSE
jgi:coenzyme F420-reducing hydrogenase alpha subunit